MKLSEKDQKVCDRYKAKDSRGFVHCHECPLVIDRRDFMCKANSHYNASTHEWEPDDFTDLFTEHSKEEVKEAAQRLAEHGQYHLGTEDLEALNIVLDFVDSVLEEEETDED